MKPQRSVWIAPPGNCARPGWCFSSSIKVFVPPKLPVLPIRLESWLGLRRPDSGVDSGFQYIALVSRIVLVILRLVEAVRRLRAPGTNHAPRSLISQSADRGSGQNRKAAHWIASQSSFIRSLRRIIHDALSSAVFSISSITPPQAVFHQEFPSPRLLGWETDGQLDFKFLSHAS